VRRLADANSAARQPAVLVILGPTATSKTAVSVSVAKELDGEIISADSRAFFTGLDIVTARPNVQEQAGVSHHGLGIVPWDKPYDAMAFRRDVERWVTAIVEREHIPMIVGGGTLYIGAVIRGLFEGPSKDDALRTQMAQEDLDVLYRRLATVDPDAARSIHPNDRLRIERALEVFASTGRRISTLQPSAEPLAYRFLKIGLRRDRAEHRTAIAARVQQMIDAGLAEEVRTVLRAGLRPEHQAYRTIGIPEMAAVFDGRISQDEAAARMVTQTWALAKRQAAWFRRDRAVHWIDVSGRTPDGVAEEVVALWKKGDR